MSRILYFKNCKFNYSNNSLPSADKCCLPTKLKLAEADFLHFNLFIAMKLGVRCQALAGRCFLRQQQSSSSTASKALSSATALQIAPETFNRCVEVVFDDMDQKSLPCCCVIDNCFEHAV